ncbi:hypothetical protein NBRC10513_006940 [Rhodotorula toruloides]
MQPGRYTHLRKTKDAPFSPLLRASPNKIYRIDSTPSTGASALSTSDMVLVGESPLSPILATRRQEEPAPSFLDSESTSGIWSHIPTPLGDRATQYSKMLIISFEPTLSEAERSWSDETKEVFPLARTERKKEEEREAEGEGGEEDRWKKVEKSRKGREAPARTMTTAKGEQGEKTGAKGKVLSRARQVAVPAPKEELRRKPKNLLRLLANPNSASTDLFLIQEPPRNLPAIPLLWRLIISPPTSLPDGEPAPTRNILLLSTRLGPAVATQVAVNSGDVVAVDVELARGEKIRVISMYNPYNERGKEVRYLPYKHSVTSVLPPLLASSPASSLIIVTGNFNLLHPEWNKSVGEPDEAAEEAHVASCAAKASKAMVGVGLLAKSRGGLKSKFVRRLVEAVVLPRLTWCAAAWYKPGTSVSKVLEQVQKAAARTVTGGYRTTSLAALEVEANLLPLDLHLTHRVLCLALRLASSPSDSSLHARFRLARPALPAKHPSPIHLALHSFPALLQPRTRVEPVLYSPLAPWSIPPRCWLVVSVSKEALVESHGRELRALDAAGGLVVYSDGLLLDGQAGVSAVV